jgi:iron complex outermembrane receptor protein
MNLPSSYRLNTLSRVLSLAFLSVSGAPCAFAQSTSAPTDLGTVGASATAGAYRPDESKKGTASALAPTQASLLATEPQSIITREFIDLSVAPTAEYSRLVNIAPSLSGDSSNGPGLSETKTTLRGFKDGEYNVTFDGIPWGDINGPSHHSTSFFPAAIIGGAVVDRGPGKASDMGYATFGGSINLFSKKPSEQQASSVFGTFGTWNTALAGFSYESGRLANYGDATVQLNYQHMKSDGYLSYSPVVSNNYTVKIERPVGDASLLTVFASFNDNIYYSPDVAVRTLAQVALYGKNFLLNNDPKSMNYYLYNKVTKATDFDYIRLQSDLGDGWNTDNKLYTYAYNNVTKSTDVANWDGTGTDPRTTNSLTRTKIAGDIPGYEKLMQYRIVGDIFKATKKLESGVARMGVWIEHSSAHRYTYDLDMTTGLYNRKETPVNATTLPGTDRPIDSVSYDEHSTIQTVEPFVEYEWAVRPDTTVTPGFKYVSINRSANSPVGATTRILNATASKDYKSSLPFLTLNHQINDGMSVYAQYAKGYVIPSLSTFYITDPSHNSTSPQTSTNYQLGLVSKSDAMTWDVDAYRIDFKNKMVSNGLTGPAAAFINIGGATYQGAEAQAAYVLGGGFSAYVNGSLNQATANDTGKQIAGAPEMTAALGALYNRDAWSGSLIYKQTGKVRQVAYAAPAAPTTTTLAAADTKYDYYQTPAYGSLDFGVAYVLKNPGAFAKSLKLQLNVFNLLNDQSVTAIAAGKTQALDTYTYQAPRSIQVSLKADF